jgi:Spy/CpxP family protein refolding chaperone
MSRIMVHRRVVAQGGGMKRRPIIQLLGVVLVACGAQVAPQARPQARSPYAGEEGRAIKTLSENDVAELRAGHGWGLAKAAELSGVAGPRHVLDLATELALSASQRQAIAAVHDAMGVEARRLGAELIEAERRLSDAFAGVVPPAPRLEELVNASARVHAELRFVHLAAHLETHALLTPRQRDKYVELRGYDSADPCASPPSGHDPAMWRRHHGCKD